MTVTLTLDELKTIIINAGDWHKCRVDAVIAAMDSLGYDRMGTNQVCKAAIAKFDRDNPIPKWHQLL